MCFSSFSPSRSRRLSIDRLKESDERCKNEDLLASDRSRRSNETIIQLTGISDLGVNSTAVETDVVRMPDENVNDFHYAENQNSEYYYSKNNLTYPPRIDETQSSPKRLSLDDRYNIFPTYL